ncbi:MAG: S1 RNA-binding domain-containing protein [Candidatus ainarchaeum sp.]|nr:S1 RNA-binding domain-containing protein [Candidatus ainarchaeum sp.]
MYPESGELVVVKVVQILNYGVFVELIEFNNAKGFIHISNVSSSWVKNIRNIVKMNQVRVAKVVNVDRNRNQIDLAFAGVSPQRERQKLTEFKQVNREEKLIQLLAKETNKPFNEVWENVADPLINEYGGLYKALEKIALNKNIIENVIAKEWINPVIDLVDKNIVVSKKTLKANLKLLCFESDGVERIKELLSIILSTPDCTVAYTGAGVYLATFTAWTFKESEKIMDELISQLEKKSKQLNIKFEFTKIEE